MHIHIVDMSETQKVREFAEAFKRQYPALNVLVRVTSLLLILMPNLSM